MFKVMRTIFDHVSPTAENIFTFHFKPEQSVRYQAGQFTEIRLPHPNPDSRGDKRWFTLSSSPSEEFLTITTKIITEASSFKKTLQDLKPGTPIDLAAPMGDFVLPKDASIPLVFVAGGIGCTPFHSIVKFLQDTGEKRQIQMIYAANKLEDVAFKDLFESYTDLKIVLKEPPSDWKGESGILDAERIIRLIGDTQGKRFYLSGPEPMIETFDKDLRQHGIDKHQIQTDFFPNYTEI